MWMINFLPTGIFINLTTIFYLFLVSTHYVPCTMLSTEHKEIRCRPPLHGEDNKLQQLRYPLVLQYIKAQDSMEIHRQASSPMSNLGRASDPV